MGNPFTSFAKAIASHLSSHSEPESSNLNVPPTAGFTTPTEFRELSP